MQTRHRKASTAKPQDIDASMLEEETIRLPWQSLTIAQTLQELDTTTKGLSAFEQAERRREFGSNELAGKPPKTLADMLREQITDPMVLILIAAAVLSAVLAEWVEAGIIGAIVVLNATIGIAQEKKAQTSLEALRTMSAPTAHVVRDGSESIVPARDLVPGDVVLLADGSMVPADLRLFESANLRLEEASLTGESVPAEKDAMAKIAPGAPLGDRSTMAYATSVVTSGRGAGIVVATGMDTEVGQIAGLMEEGDSSDTPLKRKLASFGKLLTVVGVASALAVLVIGVAYGHPFVPLLLIAVSLAISVIPEGLPATATIVMALGVQRMARHEALIRKLPAVETLGGATVVCTDKTGTLTENRMTVTRVALGPDIAHGASETVSHARQTHPDLLADLAFACALCNDASLKAKGFSPDADAAAASPDTVIGDPTEGALLVMAREAGVDLETLKASYPRKGEQPFDSDRKRMTTIHERDGEIVALTKGSIDGLLPLCSFILDAQGARPMTDEDRERTLAVAQKLSDGALRVLGCALRALPNVPESGTNVERDLVFVGLVGMIDPPRPEVRHAVEECRTAGIRTIMITGDHAATARAIGRELDIYRPGDLVVTGTELEGMDDSALAEAVRTTSVFARVSPYHKLRIVRALQRDGEIASMTGDGVNDAPALKAADIGVAMGITGTDVAKDAADMILLDDKFTTIVYAVREGRRVFRNIQKVVQFLLADNIAELVVILAAMVLNWGAPLSAVMILWVNLATATLPALALGVEPASRNVMKHPPLRAGILLEPRLARRVIGQGIFVGLLALAAFYLGRTVAGDDSAGQTMAFCVLAFSQMLRALNQRSTTDPIWNREGGRNPWLGWSLVASAAFMALVLFIPPVAGAFGVVSLQGWQWGIVACFAVLSLVQTELAKAIGKLDKRMV